MDEIPATHVGGYARMRAVELRRTFAIGGLFVRGRLSLRHWEYDRTVVGGAVPTNRKLTLTAPPGIKAAYFNERRELGILNIGAAGTVQVDGRRYSLGTHDCLYVGRGSRKVVFSSARADTPAAFYLLSYPAHARYPTRLARFDADTGTVLGTPEKHNRRVLYKYIHPGGIKSCQLVLGLTILAKGSVWNTMPPHVHPRRSEVYLYCGLPPRASVTHYMGHPDCIRKLTLRNREAALSPPWSVHCGVGTTHYSFIWGMGGENQDFADIDPVDPRKIR